MSDKCPKCGAAEASRYTTTDWGVRIGIVDFVCGSKMDDGADGMRPYLRESNDCLRRQSSRLREANAALLEACNAVLRYIDSDQIHDKDARGVLRAAIALAKEEKL